jgi:hypothetical protein
VPATKKSAGHLLSGDFVYERMSRDRNRAIASMTRDRYDAVVVPHHGDEASSAQVVAPRQPLQSKAFFSAGTHTGYGHPTPASVESHRRKNFMVIDVHIWPELYLASALTSGGRCPHYGLPVCICFLTNFRALKRSGDFRCIANHGEP